MSTEAAHEAEVVERMSRARSLADQFFGSLSNTLAVESIADCLAVAESEDEFSEDFGRMIEHAKAIYGVTAPTPEQVVGVFDRVFDADEGD